MLTLWIFSRNKSFLFKKRIIAVLMNQDELQMDEKSLFLGKEISKSLSKLMSKNALH